MKDVPRLMGEKGIYERFLEQERRTPTGTALFHDGKAVSYQQVGRLVELIAAALADHGVVAGAHIAICMERSPHAVAAMLAVLRNRCAYLAIDVELPVERVRFMLEDAQAALALVDDRGRDRCGTSRTPAIQVLGLAERGAERVEPPTSGHACLEDAAYIVYTSGSTGVPKGVVGTHRGALNRMEWMWREYPFGPHEVCCLKTSLSFSDSIWETWGPLLAGVPSVVVPERITRDPSAFVRLLAQHRVTRLVLVPSLLRTLLATQPRLGEELAAVEMWTSSGEQLTMELSRSFHLAVPGRRLLNIYGSSEVAADATWHEVRADDPGAVAAIGKPIANTATVVLDVNGWEVAGSDVGELYIGGAQVARGYWARPDLTAERFVPDPGSHGGRMYRTGDLARRREDGTLELVGRVDHQVKIRGQRVELGEIEATLAQHPSVREAAVLALRSPTEELQLEAHLAFKAEPVAIADIRRWLIARLPAVMVPSRIVTHLTLPSTASGKVDRIALAARSQPLSR